MKKIMVCIMAICMSLTFVPVTSMASNPTEISLVDNKKPMPADVKAALARLEEIKNMDKSNLSRAERKELRKEVRGIKHELRHKAGGVYLSVGAIILIVLLIIII